MKTIPAVFFLLLLSPLNVLSWGAGNVVSVRAIGSGETLKAGQPYEFTLELTIANPYHINSDHPLQDFLIPTSLEFEPQPGITFGKIVFPQATIKKLPVSDSPMALFEGTVKIAAEFIPSSNPVNKDVTIRGKIRYQACNDRVCLPPVWQSFSVALSSDLPAMTRASSSLPLSGNPETVDFYRKGMIATFLLVFLGGLALNLTPCVYPMIPITITYFGGQAQGKKGSLFLHSLLYVIGMAITYSVLGVIAAMTGGLFGAILQYAPVLIGIALVMVLLALSMFDVYELRMPAFLNRLASGSQKGFAGTLLMGLTVGIVAAPCIGPFVLGLLTYVGNKGNVFLGFALFFVLALGLGIPILVLGVFSGSLHRLPRSGAWMVWVRKIFGFILLAMAVYFLKSILHNPLAYYWTLALILFLAGIYMAWIEPTPSTGRLFPLVRNLVGILFFAVALYAAITGIETGLRNSPVEPAEVHAGESIPWAPYSEELLKQADRENKPIFIDFYADWCVPCKELDSQTFNTPAVIQSSRRFLMLKVDLTSAGNRQSDALAQKYEIRGVPTLVFLKPNGKEMPELRGTGFESSASFLDKMNRALKAIADPRDPS